MPPGTTVKYRPHYARQRIEPIGNMPIFLFHFQEGIFEIDGLNGKITLKKPLDFEGSSSYYFLNITATVRIYLVISYVRCLVYLAFA